MKVETSKEFWSEAKKKRKKNEKVKFKIEILFNKEESMIRDD